MLCGVLCWARCALINHLGPHVRVAAVCCAVCFALGALYVHESSGSSFAFRCQVLGGVLYWARLCVNKSSGASLRFGTLRCVVCLCVGRVVR